MKDDLINFDLPTNRSSIIKVLGVGGGGSNAVNHMYRQGIKDVDFIICNTDSQALANSPVDVRIQLGESVTEGRGAGNKPEIGRQAAIENLNDVMDALSGNTKMVFITAGMGGGTGTGGAPVIAKAAMDRGLLTVAIVTIPFRFEGQQRINQAIEGIDELQQVVDSLLIINNEKLREIYGDLKLSEAFSRADEILSTAARGIAEIITVHGYINVDFADVETVMRDSGVAIMGSATADGEDRAIQAIQKALSSPLLNNNDVTGARNILLNITSGSNEISMDEIGEITDYIHEASAKNALIIWGTGTNEHMENEVCVTVIATGFETNSIPELYIRKRSKDKISLTDRHPETDNPGSGDQLSQQKKAPVAGEEDREQRTIEFEVRDKQSVQYTLYDDDSGPEEQNQEKKLAERVKKLRKNHERLKEVKYQRSDKKDEIDELENQPAYIRKKIRIDQVSHSTQPGMSRYSLSEDDEKGTFLKKDNPYLHDNVD